MAKKRNGFWPAPALGASLLVRCGTGAKEDPYVWLPAISDRVTPTGLRFRWLDGQPGPGVLPWNCRGQTWRVAPKWAYWLSLVMPDGTASRCLVELPFGIDGLNGTYILMQVHDLYVVKFSVARSPNSTVCLLARPWDVRLDRLRAEKEGKGFLDLSWLGNLAVSNMEPVP